MLIRLLGLAGLITAGIVGCSAPVSPQDAARASLTAESVTVRLVAGNTVARGHAEMRPPRTTLHVGGGVELTIERRHIAVRAGGETASVAHQPGATALDDVPAVLHAIARAGSAERHRAGFRVNTSAGVLLVRVDNHGRVAQVIAPEPPPQATLTLGRYRQSSGGGQVDR